MALARQELILVNAMGFGKIFHFANGWTETSTVWPSCSNHCGNHHSLSRVLCPVSRLFLSSRVSQETRDTCVCWSHVWRFWGIKTCGLFFSSAHSRLDIFFPRKLMHFIIRILGWRNKMSRWIHHPWNSKFNLTFSIWAFLYFSPRNIFSMNIQICHNWYQVTAGIWCDEVWW